MDKIKVLQWVGIGLSGIATVISGYASSKAVTKEISKQVAKQLKNVVIKH